MPEENASINEYEKMRVANDFDSGMPVKVITERERLAQVPRTGERTFLRTPFMFRVSANGNAQD